jgi:hypothetical protein
MVFRGVSACGATGHEVLGDPTLSPLDGVPLYVSLRSHWSFTGEEDLLGEAVSMMEESTAALAAMFHIDTGAAALLMQKAVSSHRLMLPHAEGRESPTPHAAEV